MLKKQTNLSNIDLYKKIRKSWARNPSTQVINNKYKTRQQLKKELNTYENE